MRSLAEGRREPDMVSQIGSVNLDEDIPKQLRPLFTKPAVCRVFRGETSRRPSPPRIFAGSRGLPSEAGVSQDLLTVAAFPTPSLRRGMKGFPRPRPRLETPSAAPEALLPRAYAEASPPTRDSDGSVKRPVALAALSRELPRWTD